MQDQTHNHINAVRQSTTGGYLEFRALKRNPDGSMDPQGSQWLHKEAENQDIDDAVAWAKEKHAEGSEIFMGINSRSRRQGTKSSVTDLTAACTDLDTYKMPGDLVENKLRALETLRSATIPPNLIIDSGHGLQAIWFFEPTDNKAAWSKLQASIQRHFSEFESDKSVVTDEARVLRLVPFANFKNGSMKPTKILEQRQDSVSFEALSRAFITDVEPFIARATNEVPSTIIAGGRNDTLMSMAGTMRSRGFTEASMIAALLIENESKCQPPLSEREVKAIARSAMRYAPSDGGISEISEKSEITSRSNVQELTYSAFSAYSAPRPELSEQALYGLAGEIVCTVAPHTEADRAAILIQTLIAVGSILGRNAYFTVEATRHYLNLFAVLVGATSKGRKGTSLQQVRRFTKGVDELWDANCIHHGLSSGEGLIWAVRDPIYKQEPIKEKSKITAYQPVMIDEGTEDKRAFVIESEFASVLHRMGREGNTLSSTIRQAWDSGDLRVITRTNPARATGAHVSIIGHITSDELKRSLGDTEMANGFANRFLWVCVRRSQLLPEGGSLSEKDCADLTSRLRDVIEFFQGDDQTELRRDDEAKTYWYELYEQLSGEQPGLVGAVTSRAEAQVMRLACLYAVLDCNTSIQRVHLEAAFALWRYCENSARYVFGGKGDRMADVIMTALSNAGSEGLTQTSLSNLFAGHKKSDSILNTLQALARESRVRCEEKQTGGRPVTFWFTGGESEISEIRIAADRLPLTVPSVTSSGQSSGCVATGSTMELEPLEQF